MVDSRTRGIRSGSSNLRRGRSLIVPFVVLVSCFAALAIPVGSASALTPPTVTSISPGFGPLAGATSVAIAGTDFTGTTAVKFGTTAATTYTVNSATSITVVAPAESAGTINVTVTTSQGTSATSSADQFTYVTTPSVYTPPTSTIPANCSVDVGDMNHTSPNGNGLLYNWLQTLPAGTSTNPIVVRFVHNGCYLVNGGVFVRNLTDVVFDGNGATFEQNTVPASDPELYNSDPPAADYCGSGTSYGSSNTTTDTTPVVFWFDGGCDLAVENMTIQGPYSGSGGGGANQQDSGIELSGVQRAEITNVTINDVDGDFVTASGLWENGGVTYGGEPSTDVDITNNSFDAAGRQGLSLIYVDRVLVTDNTLTNSAASMFDIEADTAGGYSDNIDIADNTVVGQTYAYLVAAFTGTTIDNFAFTNNHLTDGGEMKIAMDPNGLDNATVTGNVATGVDASTDYDIPAVYFEDLIDGSDTATESNILVANNTIPSSPWNHGTTGVIGVATVWAGDQVNNLQVRNNYMPLTYGTGVPTTYNQVLPLWQGANPPILYGSPINSACGNAQGSTGIVFYGSVCTGSYSSPTPPSAPTLPSAFPSTAVGTPSPGASLSGSELLGAAATSSFGIVKVQFEISGGSLVNHVVATATPTIYGYLATWDTTTVPDGAYTIQSVAVDATLDTYTSPGISIVVNNGTQPATSVGSPSGGATLTGAEWLDASASDSGSTVTGVQYEVSGVGLSDYVIGSATATYYGWLFDWDTTTIPDGAYTLQSVASDAAGNSKPSSGLSVTVANNPAPVTNVLAPSSGASLTGSTTLDGSATSGIGIASVYFLLSGGSYSKTEIATGAPTYYGYLATWNTTTVPNGTYTMQTLAYDTAGNGTVSPAVPFVVSN